MTSLSATGDNGGAGQEPGAIHRGGRAMARFGLSLMLTLLGLTLVTFLIARVIPIDPVLVMVGDRATPEAYQAAREALGIDKPLLVQYADYLSKVVRGDFGVSNMTGQSVLDDTLRVFPATMELAIVATLIGTLLGLPLGVTAAVRQGRPTDHLIRIISLVGYSVPVFWIGLVGLLVFYAKLDLVAGPGRLDMVYQYTVPVRTGFVLIDTIMAGNGVPSAMRSRI
ncbi:ABC transporter permease [Seohaeicola zhoushanensis]